MNKLTGLKISMCQMSVVPGRPDLNTDYIIDEIYSAAERGIDIILFPEMCTTGYIIGDLYEDISFIRDVRLCNEQIREASRIGIAVIFGSLTIEPKEKGEDGRMRKFNTGLIAMNGEWMGSAIKSLHPNYRIFDDDRYFYSTRKIYENDVTHGPEDIGEYYHPFVVDTKIGEIQIGVILCEDMWHLDYPYNPTKILAENGAEIIFNLSASPWTWQKNRKRHQIVKDLLVECSVPFVYVNNTGIQNTGKNIVVFDGSSTIYNPEGDIIFEISPYEDGSFDFSFIENLPIVEVKPQDDTHELYSAFRCAIEGFLNTLPPHMRKVIVGLSGGIDSALSLALFVDVLGLEDVVAINMPFKYSSQATQDTARKIAENLGVKYEVRPIEGIVDAISRATDSQSETLTHENIQARVRMEVLAARAQDFGGVFSANWNKVEVAFGYGTLYGDMAGFISVLGDIIKREVYQLADYMNRIVYGREIIPKECFELSPSAELREEQKDPFDYGNLNRRGYHDEMVRAFVEFRLNPEWFLEQYARGRLEDELMLEPGTLARLFATPRDFIKDLERNWNRFCGSYFKRVQSAPIPIVSKRAFGTDLRESIVSSYLTQRYRDLKSFILSRSARKERIAIFGGSFNPPSKHHLQIAERLTQRFDLVIVFPCGALRPDKSSVNVVSAGHRKEMIKMVFEGLTKTQLDLFDLESDTYTPTYLLQERFEEQFSDSEIWHVVGGDIITGGRDKNSEIHRIWQRGEEIWHNLNFAVIVRPGYVVEPEDMPPSSELIEIPNLVGSGTMIRSRIAQGQSLDEFLSQEVISYTQKHKLYLGG